LQHLCALTRALEGRFVNLTVEPAADCTGFEGTANRRISQLREVKESTDYAEGDDFYSRVAFRIWQLIHPIMYDGFQYSSKRNPALYAPDYDIVDGDDFCEHRPVEYLAQDPFERGIVKKPTMSYFYGSSPSDKMKDQIIETLKKEEKPTTGATKIARLTSCDQRHGATGGGPQKFDKETRQTACGTE
jgi:hypothetical protein